MSIKKLAAACCMLMLFGCASESPSATSSIQQPINIQLEKQCGQSQGALYTCQVTLKTLDKKDEQESAQ